MRRQEISLNARWAVTWFDEGEGEAQGAHLPAFDDGGWLDGIVPGDVHLDLLRAGKIRDPFLALNCLDCCWTEDKEWWYRRQFVVPESFRDRQVELQFGGLDTFATVWVNGRRVGSHCNMFIPCSFDVSDLLEYGRRNSIAVRLSSPIKAVEGKSTDGLSAAFETHERLHARKAQMSYGWDIAPRLVTTGIWRPVYLVATGDVSIGDVAIRTGVLDDGRAAVALAIPLTANKPAAKSAGVEIEVRNGKESIKRLVTANLGRGRCVVGTEMFIDEPKLWWPWTAGRPDLYSLSVRAIVRDRVEEEFRTKFGIRSVELIQEPQEDGGRSFAFAINGRRVYAKGTNWVPGDAIFARMTRRKYRELIDLARASNTNMLRVWGGGVYEDPYFYRLCDERGIMVWQDFMFSCGEYPEDEGFLSEVRVEAEKVVASLRNHPSVVVWCGDNEVDIGKHSRGKDCRENKINRWILPEVCARLDPARPYIWSSPCSPFGDPNPQSHREGDFHNWRHGASYKDKAYTEDSCRFVSEIGHLSAPWPGSVREFLGDPWPPESKAWDFHFGAVERADPRRRERLDEAIANFGFQKPDDLEEYSFLTQLIQAVAYKEWMEHYRRRKFLCGGSLYWNLHDAWPQFSDAVVDYYQNPKIAYYFVRRAFANLLVSLEDLGGGKVGVWLINDELKDRSGKLLLRCQRLDGGTAWTRILPVKLPANSSRMVWDMRLPGPLMEEPAECFAQVQLLVNGRVVSENFHFPGEFKDIRWPEARLSARVARVRRVGGRLEAELTVSSDVYARLVRIQTPDQTAEFSDNFFDIPPGEERSVKISAEQGERGSLAVRLSASNASEAVDLRARW